MELVAITTPTGLIWIERAVGRLWMLVMVVFTARSIVTPRRIRRRILWVVEALATTGLERPRE